MQIDRANNTIARIWFTFTDQYGAAANANTMMITIYPANSNTPIVSATAMTNFATGIYYYAFDTTGVTLGQFSVRFTATLGGVVQEIMENMDLTDSSRVGSGTIANTITTKDSAGIPLEGTAVYITTDLAGANKVTATQVSDNMGIVTFFLNAGVYYVWMFRNGNTWQNPGQITVV